MALSDGGRVCLACRFFDDHSSECQRFPPFDRRVFKNTDGDDEAYWSQPHISLEWSQTCGEWQPAPGMESEPVRVEQVAARLAEWKADNPDVA